MKKLLLIILFLSILILLFLSPLKNVPISVIGKIFKKVIINEKFGVSFTYPFNLKINQLGPNSSQQQLDDGDEISGSVSPSYETYEFIKSNNVVGTLEIFHENNSQIDTNGFQENGNLYLFGNCDSRWRKSIPTPIGNITINNVEILEVKAEGEEYVSCYYLKNLNTNLIVLSSAVFTSKERYQEAEITIKDLLYSLKLR